MKYIYLILLTAVCAFSAQGQDTLRSKPHPAKKTRTVEVACGQCQFGLPGDGCDLAVRIDGKAYFVTGTHIDDHGDAHAHDGFCQAIRKAKVQGELVGDKYRVSYMKLKKKPVRKRKSK